MLNFVQMNENKSKLNFFYYIVSVLKLVIF